MMIKKIVAIVLLLVFEDRGQLEFANHARFKAYRHARRSIEEQ